MDKNYYITTTLPYVNAEPHIGFALEVVQADALARFHKELLDENVIFNTGTDEHGQKIYQKALEEGKNPLVYCNEYAERFLALKTTLNLSFTNFVRTTDEDHKKAAQHFWSLCFKNGDIEKKNYRLKYCIGCELEKTDSELDREGLCPLHPKLKLEVRDEENYFFKFSKYQNKLLEFYEKNPDFVRPRHRYTEIINFVKKGLEDFSISRLKEKMPWGVEVPDDPKHVMYVWFDALINYISTLGWPEDIKNFDEFWPGTQVAGTDNLRQQSAMWQAMLMSAGIAQSRQIFIHGFITSDGKKMSKSTGNVVSPNELVEKYGTDATRYYLLSEIPATDDGDFSFRRMDEIYNSDLANELGNLVSRVTTIAAQDSLSIEKVKNNPNKYQHLYDEFAFDHILDNIWTDIKQVNKEVNDFAPWKKTPAERKTFLADAVRKVSQIGYQLKPLLPETSQKIIAVTEGNIAKSLPLFPKS